MDSNRNYRRVPHKEAEFSSQSIMKAMETFVQAVQEMDETILVPSRLMDLEVGDSEEAVVLKPKSKTASERESLKCTDLYSLYNMVNCVKNELLWGQNNCIPEEEEPSSTVVSKVTHVRRPSLTSLASSQSLSDTDSETGNENDSGIEGESEVKPDYTQKLEESFRRHLYGLHRSLNQMATAAKYLTTRYQSDIGALV